MNTSIGEPDSGKPHDITGVSAGDGIVDKAVIGNSNYYDAIRMSDKYTIESNPQPIPELWLLIIAGIVIVIAIYVIRFSHK